MAHHHADDEAQAQRVQRDVAGRQPERRGCPRDAADREPGVAAQQAHGHVARQALGEHGTARDVEHQQPHGQQRQRRAIEHAAGHAARHADAAAPSASQQQDDQRRLRAPATPTHQARHLQPLRRDRQHQEGEPPGHDGGRCSTPAANSRLPDQPGAARWPAAAPCGRRAAACTTSTLTPTKATAAVTASQRAASSPSSMAGPARPEAIGASEASAVLDRHGPLDADHRSHEAANHQAACTTTARARPQRLVSHRRAPATPARTRAAGMTASRSRNATQGRAADAGLSRITSP